MNRLEDELRALGSHTLTPSRDLLGAATRRHHRRRRALQGGAASAGALGLATVVAFNVFGGSGAVTPAPVVRLDAQTVAMRVADAMEANEDAIEYVEWHNALRDGDSLVRLWHDYVDDGSRFFGAKGPKVNDMDVSNRVVDGRAVHTAVFYGNKTWMRSSSKAVESERPAEFPCGAGQEPVHGSFDCRYTADAIRKASSGTDPAFAIVGEETIDGREAIRLRDVERSTGPREYDDLWVDRERYQILRHEWLTLTEDGELNQKARFDYTFLPRTEANLAKLDAVIPDGFKRVPQDMG